MIKAKFGAAVHSKGETAQTNELPCKVLCHNIYVVIQSMHELGFEPEFAPNRYVSAINSSSLGAEAASKST